MKSYDIIFVVLVYRNTDDLKEFFLNLNVPNSKVIVVNSYYDSKSAKIFEEIAIQNKADYINVENKGYGAGNNSGIEYALKHYSFKWLIISNADIIIYKFNKNVLKSNAETIIAPKILTKHGKNQNPSSPFIPNKYIDYLQYKTYKNNHSKLIWLFYAWSRLNKILFYCLKKFRTKIFAPHGAFVIIPKEALSKLVPIFNEKMFLFYEENHLGKLARQKRIKIIYSPGIVINHKEDGSISLLNEKIFKLSRDSFIEYYKYWYS